MFFYGQTFPIDFGKFNVIIANWTLHFITDIEKRIQYLDRIYDNLNEGGTFILSEKVIGDDSDYLDFKRSNFLSEADIEAKKKNLKNVLVPLNESLYLNIFKDQGYKKIKILDKTYCFRTFELQK